MNDLLKSQIIELMEKLPKNVYGNGIENVDWIKSSQIKYQLNLPKEYLWFVEKYDYIILWGEFVKSIFDPQNQDEIFDDIFDYYQINVDDNNEDKDKLIFLTTEELEEFYFLIIDNQVSEQVFFRNMWGDNELYADNFLEFLLEEIPKNYHFKLNE